MVLVYFVFFAHSEGVCLKTALKFMSPDTKACVRHVAPLPHLIHSRHQLCSLVVVEGPLRENLHVYGLQQAEHWGCEAAREDDDRRQQEVSGRVAPHTWLALPGCDVGHRAPAHDLQLRASDAELVCALPAERAALAAGTAVYKKLPQAPLENQKFPFRVHRRLLGLVVAA